MKFGSLFSGIGGIDLGLERAGMSARWQVEINPFRQNVLRAHWPEAQLFSDIHEVHYPEDADVIAGGFPCQPTSQAAARTDRAEGWLWPEFARVIGQVRPRYAIIENPEALRFRRRGFGLVLRDLSILGYNATWQVLRGTYFGAPHERARVWIVAYANRNRKPDLCLDDETSHMQELGRARGEWANPPRSVALDDGIPERVALRAYGDAVMPVMAEWVGKKVMEAVYA